MSGVCGMQPAECYGSFLEPQIQNSRFKIQELVRPCIFGTQPAEGALDADLRDASCGPPLSGGCGPPIAYAIDHACDQPAAERWACDAKEQPSAQGRLRAADCFAIEFTAKHPSNNRRLWATAPIRAQIQNSRFRIQNYRSGCCLRSARMFGD